ncbi:MAG TPA: amidohydrolase family protein, partial [Candidatus Limnocylindria bacterium]
NAIAAAEVCDNIVLETSWCRPGDIAGMIARLGADRVMFGTDAPNNVSTEMAKYHALDLTESVRAAVMGGTATRVFGLS